MSREYRDSPRNRLWGRFQVSWSAAMDWSPEYCTTCLFELLDISNSVTYLRLHVLLLLPGDVLHVVGSI